MTLEHVLAIILLLFVVSKYLRSYFRVHRFRYHTKHIYDYEFTTGDLVLCQYRSPFMSGFTKSSYQHTGIVYKHPQTHQLFLWHMCAPMHNLLGTGRNRRGLRLEPLYRALFETSLCAVRKLTYSPDTPPPQIDMKWMTKTMSMINFNPQVFIGVLSRRLFGFVQASTVSKRDEQSCADVCTRTYVRMGVLKPECRKMNIFPEDFWETNDQHLLFQPGFSFSAATPLALR
jgi:hypothetical protein